MEEKKLHRNFDFLRKVKNFPPKVMEEALRAEKNYYDNDFTGSGRAIRAMIEAITAVLLEEAGIGLKEQFPNPKWKEGDEEYKKIWNMSKLEHRILYIISFQKNQLQRTKKFA